MRANLLANHKTQEKSNSNIRKTTTKRKNNDHSKRQTIQNENVNNQDEHDEQNEMLKKSSSNPALSRNEMMVRLRFYQTMRHHETNKEAVIKTLTAQSSRHTQN